MKVKMYDISGKEAGKIDLDKNVFDVEYNEALIHQVVVAQLANKRQGTKSSLTRSEVRGGGAKPWRQKGTGRARAGTTRAPHWTHGGVVFAPKPRDFSKKINKVAKKQAIKVALSEKLRVGEMKILDSLNLAAPKTKEMVAVLKALEVDGRTLLVTADQDINSRRASSNIPKLNSIDVALINVYDLVSNKNCLITADAIKKLEEAYA